MKPVEREPSWLVHMVDQRIAFMNEKSGGIAHMAAATGASVIMTSLTDPDDTPPEVWDQSCDNCKRYVPGDLTPGHVERRVQGVLLAITFGACDDCKDLP